MNNETNKLIPEIRFPEYKSEGIWDKRKLGEISNIVIGGTPSTIIDEYWNGDIGWIGSGELKNNIIKSPTKYITELGMKKSSTYLLPKGTTVLAMTGATLGKVGFLDINSCGNQSVAGFIGLTNLNSKFLFYQLQKETTQILSFAGGGAQAGINKSNIENLILHIPLRIEEQQKIADCLSSLDEVIATQIDKLETLKTYKKGLMQSLFPQEEEKMPKLRFSEFFTSLIKICFAELGEIKIGLTHKPDYINTGIPFLSSKNISGGYIDFKDIQYISKEKFESMPESTKPKVGDILFTRVGSNLGNPIILEKNIEFGIFVSLGFFRVNKKANNYYMKYWMESDLFWKQVNQKVGGGAKDNLNSTWLREFELYIPSIEEQQKIADTLYSLDNLIKEQVDKIEQLKLHKKGLMQGLFPKVKN
ncbi:hypothetical protein HYN48_12255 [Flavobacterium magnum]|uniref:Type I restriction modification DNA specificity domain-containing protein n=1 Tax=Flavobacterium magnum TaxID=2162713 RepID=A0A2S0RGY4_9FLAO|nr:restriction endonuclease subunit S [Flavobacterium magnum]AWA30789.1 hypothetical protein HYN48_12255 [Flavobacterium magnum]